MDDNDFGLKFWLKIAGLFVLGAIGLFVFMWISVASMWIGIGALNARSRGDGSPLRPRGVRG